MEHVSATLAPFGPTSSGPVQLDRAISTPSDVLHDLIAAANQAASVPAGQDFAIWQDACRQLAVERRAGIEASGPRNVLVVEASAAVRDAINRALAGAGYVVLPAADEAVALSLTRQHRIDLILADVELPSSDGIALLSQLRDATRLRHPPIMMLTTAAQDSKKIAGRRAGATGWINKPFDPPRFIAIIQQVCPAA